jgi:hypothetical protein
VVHLYGGIAANGIVHRFGAARRPSGHGLSLKIGVVGAT